MRARWVVVLVVGVVCAAGGSAGAAQFWDVGPTLNIPGSVGAAWGDYDGDGFPDLFLAGVVGPSGHGPMLLRNDQDLTFTDVSGAMGFPSDQEEQDGAAWADYDNDGDIDLIVACGSGSVKLYRNDGDTFSDIAGSAGVDVADGLGRGVAWCDYDADGWLDVFICNIMANVCHLLRNNGDGTFSDANTAAGMTGLAAPSGGNAAAWGDYDNDGRPDLMVSRVGPRPTMASTLGCRPLLYHNDGDGTFTEVGDAANLDPMSYTSGLGWADYDNDGWLDCYLANSLGGRDYLYRNNRDGTFTYVAASAGMAGDASLGTGVAWADYDNDGWLDLYVGNLETDNQPFLYHNDGDGTFTNVTATAGVAGSRPNEAAMWADVDLDGRLDLFQAVGGPTSRLFHNVGYAGNWLRLRALTNVTGAATVSELPTRDAIGARVELSLDNDDSFPSGRTLLREIDGGSGFCGQNEQVAHFGVGGSAVVCVRVLFPDGSVVTHRSVPVNRQITIRDVPADRTEEPFDDIPLDFWAFEQVEGCVEAGIVGGYEDGTYRPTWSVDRATMAVYIARALAGGEDNVPDGPAEATFGDVPTSYWAYNHVECCYANNVVQGYDAVTYAPAAEVTRAQMAVYVARAMVAPEGEAGLADYFPADPRNFPDVPDTFWSYKHIEYCVEHGVVQGYDDGYYYPGNAVTRDQMAVYVARAFGLVS